MAESRESVKTIFGKALEIRSEEERARYLDQACAEDDSLRAEIEDLLGAIGRAGEFLIGSPPPSPTVESSITEKPGTQIGPYKLLQQLGEGGMGVVYMAEQKEPVKRRVALKIIKPGMDTRQVIARFEAERQALAMMDHPNIAKVLDAGATKSGRPYFVMELVNGLPVTKYCDEQHLNPKERLELFVPICQAVQHAHQKGIIHRDLKPSNILIAMYDNKAVPKVIDFGVAKATSQTLTDKTMFTQLGQVVGTLEYMSPEQAQRNQLDIDTRSDIYSLGVVLYELLTGETPFDRARLRAAAFDEMLRIIREEEPSKPSTKVSSSLSLPSIAANRRIEPAKLGSMIRGELDWIVLKAMEKDRGRRYETASKFAEDVQHYLNDEAVVACPPSRAYKFRKFARRNKAKLVVSGLLAATLMLAVGSFGWAVRDRAARRAEIAREREEREAEIAREREQRLSQTRTQVELILNEVDQLVATKQWLKALGTSERAEAIIQHREVDAATKDRVRALLADLRLVLRLEETRLQATSETAAGGLDRASAARLYARVFREAGFQIEDSTAGSAAVELQTYQRVLPELSAALTQWSRYRRMLDSETDNARWQHLLAVADAIDPDSWRRRVRAAWKTGDEAANAASLRALADAVDTSNVSSSSLAMLAELMEKRVSGNEAVSLWLKAQRQYPSDIWINLGLASCLSHAKPPRLEEAIAYYRAAYALNPESAVIVNNLANVLVYQGKLDEAIDYYCHAIELDPEFSFSHNNLGNALKDQNKLDEAIECYHKSIELNPSNSDAHYNLGIALQENGQLDKAIECYRRAIELNPSNSDAHNNLGLALSMQGNVQDAITYHRTAIELDPSDPKAHFNLGIALYKQGKVQDAIACYRKGIQLDPADPQAHVNLGVALYKQEKLDDAITCFRKAAQLDPNYASAHNGLGNALSSQNKLDEAIECYLKAIELDPSSAGAHSNLGLALQGKGQLDKAIECYRKAIELDPSRAGVHNNLGNALSDQNKLDEAIDCFRRALELDPEFPAHNGLGKALRGLNKIDEASQCFRKAIEIDPKDAFGYNNLGTTLVHQRKLDEAIACFRKAVELNSSIAAAHENLGTTLSYQHKLDEAIECFRRSIQLNPRVASAHIKLGKVLFDQHKLDEAVACYQRVIELQPDLTLAHVKLAGIYVQTQEWDEAIREYDVLIKLNPKPLTHLIRAQLLFLENLAREYEAACSAALKAVGEEASAATKCEAARAWLLSPDAVGDPTIPLQLAKQAVAEKPQACWMHYVLGKALLRAGMYENAIEEFEASLKLKPDWPARHLSWFGLALANHYTGQPDPARQWYEKAVDRMVNHKEEHSSFIQDWLDGLILQRELEQLLGSQFSEGATNIRKKN